jgi:succinate dehydrogenase / fumarate reductase cytochrome b subunit
MATALSWYRTAVGKKVVMAVSGAILFGYVVVHLLGNLQIYLGRDEINAYARFLHSRPELVWSVRAILLAAVVAHIVAATQLYLANKRARPEGYRMLRSQRSSYASRTMYLSGPILLLFIIYHLLHLTVGAVGPEFTDLDVYNNAVRGFGVWYIAAFYILAMIVLGFHLVHGVWSFFQSLGLNHPKFNKLRRNFATLVTGFIVLGNISIPVAVMMGFLK